VRKDNRTEVEELLDRATLDTRAGGQPSKDNRYIYGGSSMSVPPGHALHANRKGVRRRTSVFATIGLLFGVAVGSVLYIGNILAVNQLAYEVNKLQAEYDRLLGAHALLQAEIDKKSSLERIGKIAAEEIGLRHPATRPVWFNVDESALKALKSKSK
jgi:hypothetical protein